MKMLLILALVIESTVPIMSHADKKDCHEPPSSADQTSLHWVDGRGIQKGRADWDLMLANHHKWLEKYTPRFDVASKSELEQIMNDSLRADFEHANLQHANLSHAELTYVDLTGADLTGADLTGANLTNADLENVNFSGANLTGAHLNSATLDSSILSSTELKCADFANASVFNIDFEPKDLPLISGIAQANELETMRWSSKPDPPQIYSLLGIIDKILGLNRRGVDGNRYPLFDLRKAMQDANYSDEARRVNASIHRMDQSWWEVVLFDWSCEWGVNYGRPVRLVLWLSIGCSFLYWILLRFTVQNHLFLITTEDKEERVELHGPAPPWFAVQRHRRQQRVVKASAETTSMRLSHLQTSYPLARVQWEWRLYWNALIFSMMSVLNLGVQGIDMRRWVRLLSKRDFDLQAQGWIRTIAGAQSVLSFVLLALAVLGYFGHLIW